MTIFRYLLTTNPDIAQTLLATSPIFIIPIAAQMGEKISIRSVFGVLVAVVKISLLFNFQ